MRYAALGLIVALSAVLACGAAARADCADAVRLARQQLAGMKDGPQRREIALLLDKAEKEAKAARERLCRDALVRAKAVSAQ
jgi:hypothetical protein